MKEYRKSSIFSSERLRGIKKWFIKSESLQELSQSLSLESYTGWTISRPNPDEEFYVDPQQYQTIEGGQLMVTNKEGVLEDTGIRINRSGLEKHLHLRIVRYGLEGRFARIYPSSQECLISDNPYEGSRRGVVIIKHKESDLMIYIKMLPSEYKGKISLALTTKTNQSCNQFF